MASTNNCSEGKSREHYVSESILERFDSLKVSGMPWQKAGESKILPANALAATILCERHNSALSPVDEFGRKAFNAFTAAADYAVTQLHSGRAQHYLISGEGLELWMFKLFAGIHHGGIASADGKRARDSLDFPIAPTVAALSDGTLPTNAGLIISHNMGLVQRDQIEVCPLVNVLKAENIGVQVKFGALQFETTVVPPDITLSLGAKIASYRRPRVVDFSGPARDARVVLSWKGWAPEVNRIKVEVRPEDI